MKQIILQVGDRVHHKTLGDGVVIAVNEDYCTARFGEKEANFRIPEAFVRGFLTSEDAKLVMDKYPCENCMLLYGHPDVLK